MKKPNTQKRDVEMQQVMTEESSRGKRRPVRAVNLEQMRQIRRLAKMLDSREYDREDYLAVIRDDFGLEDGSPTFLQYVKLWDERRGK
jgi:hypothetical protein